MTQLAQQDVIKTVREALARHPRKEWDVDILEEGVRQEDDWWYIPVCPRGETARSIHYYDLLAEVEGDLQDEMGLNILLIPSSPQSSRRAKARPTPATRRKSGSAPRG